MEMPRALLSVLGTILVPSLVRAVKVMQAVSGTVAKRSSTRFTFHAWMSMTATGSASSIRSI